MEIPAWLHRGNQEAMLCKSNRCIAAALFTIAITSGNYAMAENTMGNVNNNSGIVTQGQIGNNTLVQGNQRLQYSDALAEQLVSKLTDKAKPVRLMSIGGNADQETGSKFQAFLERRGFKVERMAIGQMAPPPERKLIYQETPQEYVVQVAPSAVE